MVRDILISGRQMGVEALQFPWPQIASSMEAVQFPWLHMHMIRLALIGMGLIVPWTLSQHAAVPQETHEKLGAASLDAAIGDAPVQTLHLTIRLHEHLI